MAPKLHKSQLAALLLLLCVANLAAGAVRRPHHKLAITQIEQLEGEWREAQLTADVAAMDRLLSDDFLGITAAGKVVTKAQQLERMRSRQFVIKALTVEDIKIKLIGGIAIVTSLANVDGVADGETMRGSFRYTRVYQRVAGGTWKITSFEATRRPRDPTVAVTRGHDFTVPHN